MAADVTVKKAAAALLAILLLPGLSACGSGISGAWGGAAIQARPVSAKPPVSPSSLTVGYVGVGDTEGARAAQMERATINGLRRAGVRVLVFRSLSLNPQPQITAAQQFANRGVNALIVDPQFSNVWGDAFATIRDQGIKVILLDRMPLGIGQSRYDASLGPNYTQLGRQAAQWVLGRLGLWTAQDQTYEYGGTPRSLVVSSLLGSAPDTNAADGWSSQAGWLMDTLDNVVVGEDHDRAVAKLTSSWKSLAKAGTLPNVVFATNQTAAAVTLDALRAQGVRLVTDPAEAMRVDAAWTKPRSSSKPATGWAVAVVCLGGNEWISSRVHGKKLAAGIALPGNYADRLVPLLTDLCADRPVAKNAVVPGTLIASPVASSQTGSSDASSNEGDES